MFYLLHQREILARLIPEVSDLPFSRAVWVELKGVEVLVVRITYVGEVMMMMMTTMMMMMLVMMVMMMMMVELLRRVTYVGEVLVTTS